MSKAVVAQVGQAQMIFLPERGGLLSRLILEDGRGEPVDILWNSPDLDLTGSGWPMGGMPFLFPFAGRVFHEGQSLRYQLNGQTYHMPLHGFAYALPWSVSQTTSHSIQLVVEDGPGTHSLFPYGFAVYADYSLERTALTCKIRVVNRGPLGHSKQDMPIAAGWHPFFRVPLRPLSRLDECFLITSASHKVRVTPQGAPGKSASYPEDDVEKVGRLSADIYRNIILASHKSPHITLEDRDSKLALETSWTPSEAMGYVVLWSRENEGFHCIEPWMNLPDPLSPGHQIKWLAKDEQFTFSTVINLSPLV